MYGQMTAGSWIYIGSQGIVQGTYETFVEMGRQHYAASCGRWILTAGLGGMGGAQPLAATMAGASMLAVECRPERIQKRLDTRYLDVRAGSLDEALALIERATASPGNLGRLLAMPPRCCRTAAPWRAPDAVTDQTSATIRERLPARRLDARAMGPPARERSARGRDGGAGARWPLTSPRCSSSRSSASRVRLRQHIRQVAFDEGVKTAFDFPASCRRTCGRCSAAVSGRFAGPRCPGSRGHPSHRPEGEGADRDDPHLHRWLDMARERNPVPGLPARICWSAYGQRHRLGLAFNEMVATAS